MNKAPAKLNHLQLLESKKETVYTVDQSPEDIIASVVNSALDDDALLNALDNKVLRAKAKAMMVKIKEVQWMTCHA